MIFLQFHLILSNLPVLDALTVRLSWYVAMMKRSHGSMCIAGNSVEKVQISRLRGLPQFFIEQKYVIYVIHFILFLLVVKLNS